MTATNNRACRGRAFGGAVLWVLLVAGGASRTLPGAIAQAQQDDQARPAQTQQDVQDQRAAGFVAVEGPTQEDVPGGALLLAAYATVWILLLLYVLRLSRLYLRAERELKRLEQLLGEASGRIRGGAGSD
ncbi:MAG: CcmD family protein [Proteobacteria bacterium]|nr:CcmD family protein [Pseudomonadota bacterium]